MKEVLIEIIGKMLRELDSEEYTITELFTFTGYSSAHPDMLYAVSCAIRLCFLKRYTGTGYRLTDVGIEARDMLIEDKYEDFVTLLNQQSNARRL